MTKQQGPMSNGKATTIMWMPLMESGAPDYCLECVGNMSIRCAWCGEPIAIGNPITLYIPNDDYQIPDYAVRHVEGGSMALVGCLGWNCASTGADMCGYWMPPGKVERVSSPVEICLRTGQMVLVGDVHDRGSISLHPIP